MTSTAQNQTLQTNQQLRPTKFVQHTNSTLHLKLCQVFKDHDFSIQSPLQYYSNSKLLLEQHISLSQAYFNSQLSFFKSPIKSKNLSIKQENQENQENDDLSLQNQIFPDYDELSLKIKQNALENVLLRTYDASANFVCKFVLQASKIMIDKLHQNYNLTELPDLSLIKPLVLNSVKGPFLRLNDPDEKFKAYINDLMTQLFMWLDLFKVHWLELFLKEYYDFLDENIDNFDLFAAQVQERNMDLLNQDKSQRFSKVQQLIQFENSLRSNQSQLFSDSIPHKKVESSLNQKFQSPKNYLSEQRHNIFKENQEILSQDSESSGSSSHIQESLMTQGYSLSAQIKEFNDFVGLLIMGYHGHIRNLTKKKLIELNGNMQNAKFLTSHIIVSSVYRLRFELKSENEKALNELALFNNVDRDLVYNFWSMCVLHFDKEYGVPNIDFHSDLQQRLVDMKAVIREGDSRIGLMVIMENGHRYVIHRNSNHGLKIVPYTTCSNRWKMFDFDFEENLYQQQIKSDPLEFQAFQGFQGYALQDSSQSNNSIHSLQEDLDLSCEQEDDIDFEDSKDQQDSYQMITDQKENPDFPGLPQAKSTIGSLEYQQQANKLKSEYQQNQKKLKKLKKSRTKSAKKQGFLSLRGHSVKTLACVIDIVDDISSWKELTTSMLLKANVSQRVTIGALGRLLQDLIFSRDSLKDCLKRFGKNANSGEFMTFVVMQIPFVGGTIFTAMQFHGLGALLKSKLLSDDEKMGEVLKRVKTVGATFGFVVGGGVVGQIIIPVPILGAFIGSIVGGAIGSVYSYAMGKVNSRKAIPVTQVNRVMRDCRNPDGGWTFDQLPQNEIGTIMIKWYELSKNDQVEPHVWLSTICFVMISLEIQINSQNAESEEEKTIIEEDEQFLDQSIVYLCDKIDLLGLNKQLLKISQRMDNLVKDCYLKFDLKVKKSKK